MPILSAHKDMIRSYLLLMVAREAFTPSQTIEEASQCLDMDINSLIMILQTHYLNGRHSVPKAGILHLAWEYAQNPADHH